MERALVVMHKENYELVYSPGQRFSEIFNGSKHRIQLNVVISHQWYN